MKTVPLSVRVDDEDAAFLANLNIDGAHTPSEKLRALLHAEQRRQEGVGDPLEAAEMFRDLLQPAKRRLRREETAANTRSDFLAKLYERIPDVAGAAFAGVEEGSKDSLRALEKFEGEQLNEVFALILEVIELGLTKRNRCYDAKGIEKRLAPILEILELINISKKRQKGGE